MLEENLAMIADFWETYAYKFKGEVLRVSIDSKRAKQFPEIHRMCVGKSGANQPHSSVSNRGSRKKTRGTRVSPCALKSHHLLKGTSQRPTIEFQKNWVLNHSNFTYWLLTLVISFTFSEPYFILFYFLLIHKVRAMLYISKGCGGYYIMINPT